MSLNDTPSGERAHIVFFGVRNAGKSSLVNALTNQTVSVVSDVAGTTTDPVRKAMELAPAGPVLIVDTPGIDDAGDVGDLRVQRAEAALNEADVAVLVVDATRSLTPFDEKLLAAFQTRRIPYVIAENKADLLAESGRAGAAESSLPSPRPGTDASDSEPLSEGADHNATASAENDGASARAARVRVSALTGEGLSDLKRALATLATGAVEERRLVGDLLTPGDVVVLVIPLDSAAPKGRIILPQQQVMRDALDAGASAISTELERGGLTYIRITDNGCGIAPEDQGAVCDRYFHTTPDKNHDSTGLGLTIAQELAHLHHGEITLQSEVGKGSIFTLRLPLLTD